MLPYLDSQRVFSSTSVFQSRRLHGEYPRRGGSRCQRPSSTVQVDRYQASRRYPRARYYGVDRFVRFIFYFGSSSDPELYFQCRLVERAALPNGLDDNGVRVAGPPLTMFTRRPTSQPGSVDEEEERRLCIYVRASPEPPASTTQG